MVEDLINSPPFYPAWLAERGESWDGPLVPHLARGQMARIGDGCQVGGMTHPAALPPLLSFNLEPDEHFRRALERAQQPLPHEDIPVTDLDLQVVASGYTVDGGPLRPWRQWCHKLSSSVAGTLHFEKLPRTRNPTSDQAT